MALFLYPNDIVPSSVSASAIIDPSHSFVSDSGYETRRAKHSRPRRRYVLEYLGKQTYEYRFIADFLQYHRFGAGATFSWLHPTAYDVVPAASTTPIILTFYHQLVTGMSINIGSPAGFAGIWRVTRLNQVQVALDGSTARGATNVTVQTYLPDAVARMSDDTWESPAKLIFPDQLATAGRPTGMVNFRVQIEEVF